MSKVTYHSPIPSPVFAPQKHMLYFFFLHSNSQTALKSKVHARYIFNDTGSLVIERLCFYAAILHPASYSDMCVTVDDCTLCVYDHSFLLACLSISFLWVFLYEK